MPSATLKLVGESLQSPSNTLEALDRRVRIVGHPFAPIGMGQHVRSLWRSVKEIGVDACLVDIYGPFGPIDPSLQTELQDHITVDLGHGINVFCINGDEIEPALSHLKARNVFVPGSYNIIYPAWELETYPDVWAQRVARFDEAWGESRFVLESLSKAVEIPVIHMPLATETNGQGLFSRRYFNIRESAFTFCFAFDFLSYLERKNPLATIAAFVEVLRQRPTADVSLVIKTNNSGRRPEAMAMLQKALEPVQHRVTLIDKALSDEEMKALVWQTDCFVSLHRSEGYGFGIAEAMTMGKPVITTGYSGNMDFCTPDTTYLVPFGLKVLAEDDYPHWQGQHWADPDIKSAVDYMVGLIDHPEEGRERGRRAQRHMLTHFSHLACGLRVTDRIVEIERHLIAGTPPPKPVIKSVVANAPPKAVKSKRLATPKKRSSQIQAVSSSKTDPGKSEAVDRVDSAQSKDL